MGKYKPEHYNPERSRENMRRRNYGMEQNQFDHLFEEQGGICPVCRERPAAHVDHDHESGAIRGILCRTCNTGLGMFGDSAEVLLRAADYVVNSRPSLPEPVRPKRGGGRPPHRCGVNNRCPGEEELRRMYSDERWPLASIGEALSVPPPSIYRYLKVHGVPNRDRERVSLVP